MQSWMKEQQRLVRAGRAKASDALTDVDQPAASEPTRDVVDRGFTDDGVTVTERRVNVVITTTEARVLLGDASMRLTIGQRSEDGSPWGALGAVIDLTADAALSLAARLSDGALKLREKGN